VVRGATAGPAGPDRRKSGVGGEGVTGDEVDDNEDNVGEDEGQGGDVTTLGPS